MPAPAFVTGVIGAIRSLGESGIRSIVASEYELSPLYWSRYCAQKVVLPSMGERPEAAVEILKRVGEKFTDRPVVMLGGEADVNLFSRHREELDRFYRIKMADASLMEALNDKLGFAELSERYGLAVPRSWIVSNTGELSKILSDITFPCLLKPPKQGDWAREDIYAMIGRWKKAIPMESGEELVATYEKIAGATPNLVVQEFVPGSDQSLYECHAYCPSPGNVAGYFIGRKIRTQPAHFGRSTYTRSWHDPEVAKVGLEALEKIGYIGPADIDLKRHERTGQVYILEINPRFSLWAYLATYSGVNLPLANYNDCHGLPLPAMHQDRVERRWLYFYMDWRTLKEYRQLGEWTFLSWLKSLLFRKTVFHRWNPKDPLPLLGAIWGYFWLRIRIRIERIRSVKSPNG